MKKIIKNMAMIGFLVLFFPYTATLLMGGRQGIHQEKALPELEYQVLYRLMAEDYSWMAEKTLDVMAILYRTECVRQGGKEEIKNISMELYEENYDRAYEAVVRTEGQVVTIDGKYKELPYHAVSAGNTRDGRLLGEEYDYIVSVACPDDLECDSYLQVFSLAKEELCEALGEDISSEELSLERDSTDYVTTAVCGTNTWQGENFRTLLRLPSSCFWLEETENGVRVTVKGSGHGFGISLYTADRMIREGKEIAEIFQTFYRNTECITIL